MREIFTYGSVGGASGDRCIYPEADGLPQDNLQLSGSAVCRAFNSYFAVSRPPLNSAVMCNTVKFFSSIVIGFRFVLA